MGEGLALAETTRVNAYVGTGDSGVGFCPVEGQLTLSDGDGNDYQVAASDAAIEAAEHVWSQRSGRDLSTTEMTAMLRAAVDHDATSIGLVIDWAHASVSIRPLIVEVDAPAWLAPARR